MIKPGQVIFFISIVAEDESEAIGDGLVHLFVVGARYVLKATIAGEGTELVL